MIGVLIGGAALWAYSYAGYPVVLLIGGAMRRRRPVPAPQKEQPLVTITVPAYNEEEAIAETLEAILATDYPTDRLQIVVISDASSDRTDEIVRGFAARGVELMRLSERKGKTAAENAARMSLRGEIIVNTDASVRIHPGAVRALVAALADESVGLASSRDVSIAHRSAAANPGEGAYVGYEMWVRSLETRVDGIVGASGCLYAVRAELHREQLPDALSRDFAAALVARAHGYRSVSVPDAVCFVPRSAALRQEYRRKVRTMTRGLATLWFKRAMLNPFQYGAFAWMLASHKLCRWMLPWATVAMLVALGVDSRENLIAQFSLAAAAVGFALAGLAWYWPSSAHGPPQAVALPAFTVMGIIAGLQAWIRFLTGARAATWEPTRRGTTVKA